MGSVRHDIPALAQLDSKHVLFLKGGNKMRNKMESIMRIVEKMAREKNAWNGKMSDWDYDKGQGERLGLRYRPRVFPSSNDKGRRPLTRSARRRRPSFVVPSWPMK